MAALDPKNLATFPPLKEFKASDGITISELETPETLSILRCARAASRITRRKYLENAMDG